MYLNRCLLQQKTISVIVNYRGLVCEGDEEEAKKFIIEYTSCSDIKVGDIVRKKKPPTKN